MLTLELRCFGANSEGDQLMAQADPHHRNLGRVDECANRLHGFLTVCAAQVLKSVLVFTSRFSRGQKVNYVLAKQTLHLVDIGLASRTVGVLALSSDSFFGDTSRNCETNSTSLPSAEASEACPLP